MKYEIVAGKMRCGDEDREKTLDLLRKAYSEGYLSSKEFDDRLDSAISAKYSDELTFLGSDLPLEKLEKISKLAENIEPSCVVDPRVHKDLEKPTRPVSETIFLTSLSALIMLLPLSVFVPEYMIIAFLFLVSAIGSKIIFEKEKREELSKKKENKNLEFLKKYS